MVMDIPLEPPRSSTGLASPALPQPRKLGPFTHGVGVTGGRLIAWRRGVSRPGRGLLVTPTPSDTGGMTSGSSEIRREYHIARGYLTPLRECMDNLNRLDVHTAWTDSARLSVEHVDPMLLHGVESAEQDQDSDNSATGGEH